MTKGETNLLLYAELDKLLNDICKFLNQEISNGFLSSNGRSVADTLIQRSKHQLQAISVAVTIDSSDNTNEPYVDMQGYKANQDQEYPESQEVYSDVVEAVSNPSSADDDHISCPYANLPATEIKEGKTGQLFRKEKILFFEQQKKIYAAILQSWLLIYFNENSSKPCQTFDLTRYGARPSTPQKDVKKREEGFDLFNNAESKSYHFIALTSKDAMQWVVAINRQNERRRSLPPVPEPVIPDSPSSRSSNNDYEPLKEYQIKQNKNSKISKPSKTTKQLKKQPLPLPPRNTKPPVVPQIIPRVPSDDSLSDDYDSVVNPGTQNFLQDTSNSFSEDDDDETYDIPTDLKQKVENSLNTTNTIKTQNTNNDEALNNVYEEEKEEEEEEEEEMYDLLQTLPTNKPPNSINGQSEKDKKSQPQKPKPTLKPKIFSVRHRRKDSS